MRAAFVFAVAILLGLLIFLFQQLRHFGTGRWRTISPWQKIVRISSAIIPLILFSMVFYGFFIEPNRLMVHQETIQIDNWPAELSGLRIALIGEVHTGAWFIDDRKLQRIVELTNQQQPDLVVLLGDYMVSNSWHSHRVEPEVTAAALKNLKAPLGVYAVLGNHDWWYNGKKVIDAFEQNGIRVLEGEVAEVKWRDRSFFLVGIGDVWTRSQYFNQTIDKIPTSSNVIILTHNPDYFPAIPQNVPLMLAAHTHGGQVNLPLIGRPVEPSDYGQRYAAGHVYENSHHLFVTTGIGTSIMPVRFRVTPEIVILTVKSGK
jgi:uncharacterized protein